MAADEGRRAGPGHAPVGWEEVPCVACGADEPVAYALLRDRFYPGGEEFRIVRCRRCGLFYLNPRPTVDTIGAYYPDDYIPFRASPPDLPAFSPTPWKRRLKELVLDLHYGYHDWRACPRGLRPLAWLLTLPLASRFEQVLPAHGNRRLLDIGCGTGSLLTVQAKHGWQTWGVEPSPKAGAAAQSRGHEVFIGTVRDADYADAFFDVITFHHSLEHIHDPEADLREAFRILAPGGRLLVALPNAGGLGRRVFGRAWFAWEPPRHLWHFSVPTLRRLLERVGFRVLGATTPTSALLLWRSTLLALRRGTPERLQARPPRAFALATVPLRGALRAAHLGDDLEVWAARPGAEGER